MNILRAVGRIKRAISLMIGRAVIRAAAADGGRVLITIGQLDDETSSGVELAEPWGLTSVPLAGAEALTLSVMGERGNKVAISMGDRRHRPRDLVPGETALFDDQGAQVAIRRDRTDILAPSSLVISAPSISIQAGAINIAAGAMRVNGQAVATVGDKVRVTSGSSVGEWPIVTGVGDDG